MIQKRIKDKILILDDQDSNYLDEWTWHLHPTKSGTYVRGYKLGNRKSGLKYIHRVLTNAASGRDVDHINGDPLDNRRCNLRICSRSENNANQRKKRESSSKYKGVHFEKYTGKWRAEIVYNYQKVRLGRFATESDAAEAYLKKAKELFGEYAYQIIDSK